MKKPDGPIFVAGDRGMVGSAVVELLNDKGIDDVIVSRRDDLDLSRQKDVESFFENYDFSWVVIAAAKVGGIMANSTYPAEFIYQNLMIQSNIINSAHNSGVKNLVFLGSSCIYPKHSPQPISEHSLLSGHLEPTNEPYAIAKIAGIKLCESYNRQYGTNYVSLMPTNLYGPNDNFHPENSHVLPSLIRKFHSAKSENKEEVEIWGTGSPKREFLHVRDLASACLHIMSIDSERIQHNVNPMESHINVGTGIDHSISRLAEIISEIVGYGGQIKYDSTKPDGTPRKLLDVSLMKRLGWQSSISLEEGIKETYDWYLRNENNLRQ